MKNLALWACVLLGVPALALAQAAPAPLQAHPADASAAVTPVVYQSVFANTPIGVEMTSIDWKKANADVGQFTRGHADILKWEASQTPPAAGQKPALPVQPTKPASHQH